MLRASIAVVAALALAGCASRQVEVESDGEVITPVMSTNPNVLASGSTMEVQLNQALSTEGNKVGDTFTANVVSNVTTSSGDIIIPAGAVVSGRISALDDSDHPADQALIQLQFNKLTVNGRDYTFGANVSNVAMIETSTAKSTTVAKSAATGAAIGAAIGAIFKGRDLEAILKGGAIGAAAGTVISLGVGDVEHVIPAGTRMTIQSTQQVSLR
jgi:hypothetical protein